MKIDNILFEKSIKILKDLISFKTISGENNSSLINYCEAVSYTHLRAHET